MVQPLPPSAFRIAQKVAYEVLSKTAPAPDPKDDGEDECGHER